MREAELRSGPCRSPSIRMIALCAGLILAGGASGCGGSAPEAEERDLPSELVIFVYDRSGSITDYQLELARGLTSGRVRRLDHGDRIVAMELLEASLEEPPHRWSQLVPEREYPDLVVESDEVMRRRFLRDAVAYMERFNDASSREPTRGTDILSTLHDVAADLRAYRDYDATLYLFSDMLQANPTLDFEQPNRQPPLEWIDHAAAEDELPDLSGLCVVVVGARTDTGKGQAVKEFWTRYFEATGAILRGQNYTLRPVELPEAPCGR